MQFLAFVGRYALAGVFLMAGLPKLRRPRAFRLTVARYQLLPTRLVRPVANAVPVLECGCAGLLLVGLVVRPMAFVLAVLLMAFAAAVAINVARGRSFDCGCGGAGQSERIGWSLVVRNAVLAAWALEVSVVAASGLSLSHPTPASTVAVDGARALAAPLLAAILLATGRVGSAVLRLRRALIGVRVARVTT